MELTKNNPTVTLHKRFLGFNLTYMKITENQLMQYLNVTTMLTPKQLEQLPHKLLNYTMVNYDSLRAHLRQIDENYPYTIPILLLILITVLGTLMIGARIIVFFYCKCKNAATHSDTFLEYDFKST